MKKSVMDILKTKTMEIKQINKRCAYIKVDNVFFI